MRLADLAESSGAALVGGDVNVTGITFDSRAVRAGDLFVAVPGEKSDGLAFVPQAIELGAVAICAIGPVPGIPTIVTGNPRRALAFLAAAFNHYPARDIPIFGITGSLGKTSTAQILSSLLQAAHGRVGLIGSLGIHFRGETIATGMTTPEATDIHAALRRMVDGGAAAAVMEVTSHAILLHRVAGLAFKLGIMTNLVPDEHLEFHPTPEHYVRTKARFLNMLSPGAPLVTNFDDDAVMSLTSERPRPRVTVSCSGSSQADVTVRGAATGLDGSSFELHVSHPLTTLGGGTLEPLTLPLSMNLLGAAQIGNAALAATAALLSGVAPGTIASALAQVRQARRRLECIYRAGPVVLDDTVGNPASLDGALDMAGAIPHRRLRIVFSIRGARGAAINERLAAALASRAKGRDGTGPDIIVTSSRDSADARNTVTHEEHRAVIETFRRLDVSVRDEPDLASAISAALAGADRDDLILLLGAQGMDAGAAMAREVLASVE